MKRILLFFPLILLLVAACTPSGSSTDENAAQLLLPQIVGYESQNADNIVDAITAAGSGGALVTGNPGLAGVVYKLNDTLQCLQDTGSIGANTYVESQPADLIPKAGFVAVINQDRFNQNLVACIASLNAGGESTLRSQSVTLEPCASSGQITFRGNGYTYIYAATASDLCSTFQGHFNSVQQTNP